MADFAALLERRLTGEAFGCIVSKMQPGQRLLVQRSVVIGGAQACIANNDTNASRRFVSQL